MGQERTCPIKFVLPLRFLGTIVGVFILRQQTVEWCRLQVTRTSPKVRNSKQVQHIRDTSTPLPIVIARDTCACTQRNFVLIILTRYYFIPTLANLFCSDVDNAERDPSSLRQRYSPSSSNIDKGVLLGNDLAKAHTAIAKKYSLPPRARKDIPQIETRARTRSADNEVQEAYDNPAISTETNDEATPRKKLSLTNRLESPFYTEPSTKTATQPLPSARARYGKPKKEEVLDPNSNALPAVKDEVQRKGSVVLVSKSQTGETCFQVKTPADFRKKAGKEKIQSSVEFNV